MVWDSAEITLALMVGCGPAFKWLWLRARNYPRGLAIREYGHGGRVHEETMRSVNTRPPMQRKGSRAGVVVLGDVDVEGDGDLRGGWVASDNEVTTAEEKRRHELSLLEKAKHDAFEIRPASMSSHSGSSRVPLSGTASSSSAAEHAPWDDVHLPELAHYRISE